MYKKKKFLKEELTVQAMKNVPSAIILLLKM